jgi:hypothetical protein
MTNAFIILVNHLRIEVYRIKAFDIGNKPQEKRSVVRRPGTKRPWRGGNSRIHPDDRGSRHIRQLLFDDRLLVPGINVLIASKPPPSEKNSYYNINGLMEM